MSLKRKSAPELFPLQKRAKTEEGESSVAVEAEGSEALIRKLIIDDFKGSPKFQNLLEMASLEGFVEGFYSCRNWWRDICPQYALKGIHFCTVDDKYRVVPPNFLKESERALTAKIEDEQALREEGEVALKEIEEEVASSDD